MDLQLGKYLRTGNIPAVYLEGTRHFMERKMKRNKRNGGEEKRGRLICEMFYVLNKPVLNSFYHLLSRISTLTPDCFLV